MSKKYKNGTMFSNFIYANELLPQLREIEKYFNEPGGRFFKKNGFFVQALFSMHLILILLT